MAPTSGSVALGSDSGRHGRQPQFGTTYDLHVASCTFGETLDTDLNLDGRREKEFPSPSSRYKINQLDLSHGSVLLTDSFLEKLLLSVAGSRWGYGKAVTPLLCLMVSLCFAPSLIRLHEGFCLAPAESMSVRQFPPSRRIIDQRSLRLNNSIKRIYNSLLVRYSQPSPLTA